MRKTLALFAVVLSLGLTVALDAEAKRLGGGKSAGMQRQSVTAPANTTPGAAPGTPGQAARTAATAAASATAMRAGCWRASPAGTTRAATTTTTRRRATCTACCPPTSRIA